MLIDKCWCLWRKVSINERHSSLSQWWKMFQMTNESLENKFCRIRICIFFKYILLILFLLLYSMWWIPVYEIFSKYLNNSFIKCTFKEKTHSGRTETKHFRTYCFTNLSYVCVCFCIMFIFRYIFLTAWT